MFFSISQRWIDVTAGATLALAVASSASAQGKSQGKGHAKPPSRSTLPAPTAVGGAAGTTPFGWVDDANLLSPGEVWLGVSMVRWQGTDASEVDAPVVDAAVGVSPRLQLGLSAPRVVGSSDPTGAAGGFGTTYVNAKISVLENKARKLKVAVSPTIEILGGGALEAAPADQSRVQWGAPVSVQLDLGAGRLYGSTGYFSRGVWFFGAGAGLPVNPHLAVSASVSRSWSTQTSADPLIARPNRNEISGGAAYSLTPKVGLFGSLGHSVATTDEDGAGATMSVGLSVLIGPAAYRK